MFLNSLFAHSSKKAPQGSHGGPIERLKHAHSVIRIIHQQRVGVRLLWRIVIFSVIATLISTGIGLYIEYRNDLKSIETRLDEIQETSVPGIANSLYDLDLPQVKLQLEGILKLPEINAAEVWEKGATSASINAIRVGQRATQDSISREYRLIATNRKNENPIGVLYVEATLSNIQQQLGVRLLNLLVTQGIQIFIVSLFILFVVERLITRHIGRLADFVDSFDIKMQYKPFQLQRKSLKKRDELDRMADSINRMCQQLQSSYHELEEVNLNLKRDIEMRLRAEAEVNHLNSVLEQRVRQRTADLEAVNKELSAFSYSVSHDLRAPLRRVDGFAQMLKEHYTATLGETGSRYIDRICAGITDLSEMIDSFMKLSHASRENLTVEAVDLTNIAESVIAELRGREPNREVNVQITAGLFVQGDPRLLRVVLRNLLENAWKYTKKSSDPTIIFDYVTDQTAPYYYVQDNGVGFNMMNMDRLFKPFSRLHSDAEFEGTGIGLATVRRIITRHGGRIWATSNSSETGNETKDAGRGATFCFTLWEKAT